MYIALIALIPCLGGLLSAFIPFCDKRARNIFIESVVALTSLCALSCALFAKEAGAALFRLAPDFVCAFSLDGFSRVFVCLVACLWPLATLYSFEYMEHESRTGNFYVFYTVAYGVTLLLSAARNLFTLYIFFECLTVVTLPLVEHEQNKEAYRAGRTYLMYLIGGTSLGVVAMIIAQNLAGGHAAFARGGAMASDANGTYVRVAFILAFLGFGVKGALFPLCRWLPKASVAPTPVTALLHAVAVVNAGVFAVTRCAYYVFPPELVRDSWAQYACMLLSAVTILYGAVRALRESHLKRRLAWSTVSNLGYMLFAVSLLTDEGLLSGVSHMIFHSLIKIVLFFCAGAIMVKSGKTDVHETRGLAKRMPFTVAAFTFAGAALTGVPPLCVFTGKYLIITAALEGGSAFHIFGVCCLIASAILTAFYIFYVVVPAYFAPATDAEGEIRDMGPVMKLPVALILALMTAVSLLAYPLYGLIERTL